MASALEPGTIYFVARSKDGITVYEHSISVGMACAGTGSPDGVRGAVTWEQLATFNPNMPFVGDGGFLEVWFQPNASDGLDASDSVWEAPITKGTQMLLLQNNATSINGFNDTAFADHTAIPAGDKVLLARRQVRGAPEKWGYPGAKIYMPIEDDTA